MKPMDVFRLKKPFDPNAGAALLALSTFWLNAQDAALLYSNATGTLVTTDGQSLTVARDATGKSRLLHGAGTIPTYRTNVVNGKSAMRFVAGTNRYYEMKAATGPTTGVPSGSALTLATPFAVGGKTIIMAASVGLQGGTQRSLICDASGGYFYPYFNDSGANSTLTAEGYDGSTDAITLPAFARSTWCMLTIRHDGSTMKVRRNAGAWSSVAHGNSGSLAGAFRLGSGYTTNVGAVDYGHVAMWNTALTDADIYTVEAYLGLTIGLSL